MALLIAAGYFTLSAWRVLSDPIEIAGEPSVLSIAGGTSMSAVARRLHEMGVIREPVYLNWYARLTGLATKIQAGEYEIADGTTPIELLDKLVAGDVVQHTITIVEGIKFSELLDLLRSHPAIMTTDLTEQQIMARLGQPDVHPEGQFMPDTYRFPRGTPDIDLLSRAHAEMAAALADVWRRRSDSAALANPYDALILASIIEKETALATERREISGVFNRRLARGIRLQTDPTVIYGLGVEFDGNLRRADILRDSPYNTYTRPGLPPTPIALPGYDSLQAAVDPAPGESLYFVATGREDGSHYFSTTLEEHNRAVQEYLRRLRTNEQ